MEFLPVVSSGRGLGPLQAHMHVVLRTGSGQPCCSLQSLSSRLTAAAGDQGYSIGFLGSCSVRIFGDEPLCILRYQHEFSSGPR